MLLSRNARLGKLAPFLAAIAFASVLSGCQVRPLYGSLQDGDRLQSIAISEPTSRLEQKVRNQLIFLFSGGSGEPSNPAYDLKLSATTNTQEFLAQRSMTAPRPGHVVVKVKYVLSRDGIVLAKGTRSSQAMLDYPTQQFAVMRAIRDAEDRAAVDVAEQIRTDVSIALSK